MDVSVIVKAIDDRIAALQQAKTLLSATAVPATEKRAKEAAAAIQPKNVKGTSAAAPAKSASGRKPMSEEGRARIAAAQKKRWALKNAGTAAVESGAQKAASKTTAAKTSAAAKKATAARNAVPAKKVAAKKSAGKKIAAKQVEPSTEVGTPETEQTPN